MYLSLHTCCRVNFTLVRATTDQRLLLFFLMLTQLQSSFFFSVVLLDIVRERCEVALNWIKISENILNEHTDLRRLLFTNTLSKSPSSSDEMLSETIRTAVNITELKNKAAVAATADTEGSSSTTTITEAYGAFE